MKWILIEWMGLIVNEIFSFQNQKNEVLNFFFFFLKMFCFFHFKKIQIKFVGIFFFEGFPQVFV